MFESILFRLLVRLGSLSLIHAGLKSPNSYEIAYDKYRESLPTHVWWYRVSAISQAGDMMI